MSEGSVGIGTKFIEFCLGNENYAVPLLSVKEVISKPETTMIPNVPSYFVGIMNLRGQVITIIDLRKKLSIKPKAANHEEAVIIVSCHGLQVGLIVDSISHVIEIEKDDQVVPQSDLSNQVDVKFINGILKIENRLVVLLNISEVLDAKSIQKLSQAKAA